MAAAGRFAANVRSQNGGSVLQYRLSESGRPLAFSDVFELWEHDPAFAAFHISLFVQSGFDGYVWETAGVCAATVQADYEFVIHRLAVPRGAPDRRSFAAYFDATGAPDGIVSFRNIGGDALLVVPSPLRADEDYRDLAAFFRDAPLRQQLGLWRELGRAAKRRLSTAPMWISVAGGGVFWLHVRLDDRPKYYRYTPFIALGG